MTAEAHAAPAENGPAAKRSRGRPGKSEARRFMPLQVAEAFILQTHPLREADKIVSYFTREHGKRRGIAFGARRSRTRFGARLEPLTRVKMRYFEQEQRDLDRLDNCELIASLAQREPAASGAASARPGEEGAELLRTLAIACMVEVADRMLPEHETNDTVFRLLEAVTGQMRRDGGRAGTWLALSYFLFWMARLGGFLPDFRACSRCHRPLAASDDTWYDPIAPGLFCESCREHLGSLLPAPARQLGLSISGERLELLAGGMGSGASEAPAPAPIAAASAPGRELRRFLLQRIEDHLEHRLKSWPLLAEVEVQAETA